MTEFLMVPEFQKELKKLQKKYPNLKDDLINFRNILDAKIPDKAPGTLRISNVQSGQVQY